MADVKAVRRGPAGQGALDDVLRLVREGVGRIRFGSIALTIHDGRIVQFDVTERKRFQD